MFDELIAFVARWLVLMLALWLASRIWRGITIESPQALMWAALLLGVADAVVRPLLILLTLPLTLLTLGLFLLVINALMLQLVAWLAPGFRVRGFWTAFFAALFISVFSLLAGGLLEGDQSVFMPVPGGVWV